MRNRSDQAFAHTEPQSPLGLCIARQTAFCLAQRAFAAFLALLRRELLRASLPTLLSEFNEVLRQLFPIHERRVSHVRKAYAFCTLHA